MTSFSVIDTSGSLTLICNIFDVSQCFRFHKLVWGYGSSSDVQSGLIVGGCDAGRIVIYDAARLLKKENGIIANLEGHSGAVRALDFNSFQVNRVLVEWLDKTSFSLFV